MFKKVSPLVSLFLIAVFILAACAPAATPTQAPAAADTVAPTTASQPVQASDTPAAAAAQPTATTAAAQPTAAPAATATNTPVPPATFGKGETAITMWTKEGEADGGLQFVQKLAQAFVDANPDISLTVVSKDVETLRQDFQTSSLGGNPPDLLWTVSDHVGPFVAADLIQPVDGMVDLTKFVPSITQNDKTWAIPISSGNHLMLLYNKDLLKDAPKDTADMIAKAQALTKDGSYGLVYNQTEPFWLVPWLGGFGGQVFKSDGKTPTLDTPEMVKTLQFLYDIKYTTPIVPKESDYNGADSLFKEGKAAMIINGDWSLADYQKAMGDKLGVAPLPKITATGKMPAPFTSGVYFMIPKDLTGAKLDAAKKFIAYATSDENQKAMVKDLKRLPALKTALADPSITGDPILAASAQAMTFGTPMPTQLEMRCIWDSLKPEMQSMLANAKGETPADAAKKAQASAETCIKQLQ